MKKRTASISHLAICQMTGALLASFLLVGSALADPPENQEYVGAKTCASCHFEQYATWKKSGHSKAFDILTAKYQKDQKCLKCHTTGLGEPTGYVDQTKTAALAGVTCETCHGPGSEHAKIGQKYANAKTLTADQETEIKGSIWLLLPKNVCAECHTVQGHKESETPPAMRSKK